VILEIFLVSLAFLLDFPDLLVARLGDGGDLVGDFLALMFCRF
jgi:hypothetical protein